MRPQPPGTKLVWEGLPIPESWNELTRAQFDGIAELDLELVPTQERRLKVFALLAGITLKEALRIPPFDLMAPVPHEAEDGKVHEVMELLPWLSWTEKDPAMVRSHMPTFFYKNTRWIGPADALVNFTVQRWGVVDEHIAAVGSATKEQRPQKLNELMGALYMPASRLTGKPLKWNMPGIDARGERLAGLPPKVKLTALLNYIALRGGVELHYPLSFSAGKASGYGIHGLIVDLAESTTFGGIEKGELKANDALLCDVLVFTERALERQEERKRHTTTA